jgi:CheY-like chemotaxis protein
VNERILIIDDEPSIHEVVRAYLEREGFIVCGATSGDEGLELAMSKRPELVVLDLMLPDVSGEEICRPARTPGQRIAETDRSEPLGPRTEPDLSGERLVILSPPPHPAACVATWPLAGRTAFAG